MKTVSAIIYTRGTKGDGMGHISREIILARELSRRGVAVAFRTERDTAGAARLASENFGLHLDDFVPSCDIAIVDYKNGPEPQFLKDIKENNGKVVVVCNIGYPITHTTAIDSMADLAVYGGELIERPRHNRMLCGSEYIQIDPAFSQCIPDYNGHILIVMGGADPHNLTIGAIDGLRKSGRSIVAIRGPAADFPIAASFYAPPSPTFIDSPQSLLPYMHGAALCITSVGVTAFEALAAGVPVVLTGWSEQHMETAAKLMELGMAYNAGIWSTFSGKGCQAGAMYFLDDIVRWRRASLAGRELVDGRGAERVADVILGLLR